MQTKQQADIINLIKDFINSLSHDYKIHDVFLFGSHVHGSPTEESDIDIAIIIDDEINELIDFDIFKRAQYYNLNLEPVVFSLEEFNQDTVDLIVEIKNKGKKIV